MKFGWLAEAPEIRPKLHHKVGQPTGHRHLGNPQVGELWEGSAAATRGMGM
jgi:hypothetical protein